MRREVFNNINMVPYLDVMLVLLIIFMICAPLQAPMGLKVKLPTAESEAIAAIDNPTNLVITAQGEAKLVVGNHEINILEDTEKLKVWLLNQGVTTEQIIYVQADKQLSWQHVLAAIVRIHSLGWGRWALMSSSQD